MAEQTFNAGAVATVYWSGPTTEWDWTNIDDVRLLDGHYATVEGKATLGSSFSYYLDCTAFGFNIPTGSIINGILVKTACYYTSTQGDGNCSDYIFRIIKGGIEGSVNKATGSVLPTTPQWVEHGSASDLWGESWTPAAINASNFGVRQAVAINARLPYSSTAYIDYVSITVYYTTPSVSVAITGKGVSSGKGTLARSGTANVGILGRASTAGYAGAPPAGTASVSLLGRSVTSGRGELFAAAPGSGMFMWNWPYGSDAYWHEVLGSLMPESEATISGVGVASSLGTPTSVTDGQISLSGVQVAAASNLGLGLAYAEVFITGLGVTSAVEHVSPAAHGDVNVPTVGRYATASIGTLIAAGTSVSFASGVWLLYPVTIFVEQQWQCEVEVSEVANV